MTFKIKRALAVSTDFKMLVSEKIILGIILAAFFGLFLFNSFHITFYKCPAEYYRLEERLWVLPV